jgi:hypothetical protein
MCCSSPMKLLFKIGKYSIYWAGKHFVYRGLWTWNGKKNIRILPLNKFFEKIESC